MIDSKNKAKVIFHIDMNMFFCSVAVIDHPQLKGKAFAIGRSNTTKGVISTASYEARKYGIHSAMPQSEALRIKPDLIIVEANFNSIKDYHYKFINVIRDYTKIIEVASIDEVYADMTEVSKNRSPIEVAKEIQHRLVKMYHLPCSIGIAPTLFLAKMASDMKKPLGLTIIRKRDAILKLGNLSVKDIYGVGKKTWPRLIENNIKTINDFLNEENKDLIIELVGNNTYNYVIESIKGNTSNIVNPDRYAKNESISTSQTYDNYLVSVSDVLFELRKMTLNMIERIKKKKFLTKTISITLRDRNFYTITRSKTIDFTDDFYIIFDVVSDLVESNYKSEPLRLVGVGFSNLRDKNEVFMEDYNLFTYESILQKRLKINDIIESINQKYNEHIIDIGIKKEEND
jgi:DNA polymerase-4